MSKPQSVFYEDGRVNLRSEIEATLPTERIKLRGGPFNGVTSSVESGEMRLIITQHQLSTYNRADIAYEYRRDTNPQFSFAGFKEFVDSVPEAVAAEDIDETDYREGFFNGLHRAVSLAILRSKGNSWKAQNALNEMAEELRDIAKEMGYDIAPLYSAYADDDKHI